MYVLLPRATTKEMIQRELAKRPIDKLKWNIKNSSIIQKKEGKEAQRNVNRGDKQKMNNKMVVLIVKKRQILKMRYRFICIDLAK